jgi:hypothetical protein
MKVGAAILTENIDNVNENYINISIISIRIQARQHHREKAHYPDLYDFVMSLPEIFSP